MTNKENHKIWSDCKNVLSDIKIKDNEANSIFFTFTLLKYTSSIHSITPIVQNISSISHVNLLTISITILMHQFLSTLSSLCFFLVFYLVIINIAYMVNMVMFNVFKHLLQDIFFSSKYAF